MKKSLTLLVVSIFTVGASLATLSVSAYAAPTAKTQQLLKIQRCKHHLLRLRHAKFGHNKHLTVADARIITKAALLMQDRKNIDVGKIDTKQIGHHKLYLIQLVNKKHHTVRYSSYAFT